MPTRLVFGHYSAWIKVEDQEVEHYSIEVDEEKKEVVCWIASEQGKAFSINVQKFHAIYDCGAYPVLDGFSVNGEHLGKDFKGVRSWRTTSTGLHTARPFLFSSLDSTDDDSFLDTISTSKSIGEIKIVFKAFTVASAPQLNTASNFLQIPELQKVHERSKKALAHRVKFGDEVQMQAPLAVHGKAGELLATFIFRYRSLDMLQANGLAPRAEPTTAADDTGSESGSNTPSGCKRKSPDVKEESDDETEDPEDSEEKRREAELMAEVERIRNARNARKQGKPPKKKVKAEPRPVFLPGEVIDLT